MIKQLRKVGNSQALILDKPILELLGLEERGTVQLTITNGALVVTAVQPAMIDSKKFDECLDRVIEDWGDVLKRLA